MVRKCCQQNVLRILYPGMNRCLIQFSLYRGLTGKDFGFLNLSNASIDRLRVPKYHCNGPDILFFLAQIFTRNHIFHLWQGDIFYESISIKKNSTAQNIKMGLTYCPQGNRVFDEMSVLDNLEIGGFNLPKKLLKERIEIILQTFPALSREEREGTRR